MQVLVDMIDLGANLQAASDMARFQHSQGDNTLELETQLYNLVGTQLTSMGHKVERANGDSMGGYQAIYYSPPPDAYYRAASDHRKDGQATGW